MSNGKDSNKLKAPPYFKAKKKRTKKVKEENIDILQPTVNEKYHTSLEDDPFISLMEAVNLRSTTILSQPDGVSPQMDLSALYCLATTVQEYARHLNTPIIDKKRAIENEPPLSTLFTDDTFSLEHVAKKYKTTQIKEDVTTEPYVHDDDDD